MLFSSSLGLWDRCAVRLTMLRCGCDFWSLRNPAQVPAPPSPWGPLGASLSCSLLLSLWDGHPEEPARMSDYFMMTFWSRAGHAGRGTKTPLRRGRCQAFMMFVLSKNAQWHVLVGKTRHWNLNELWNFKHESLTVSGRPWGVPSLHGGAGKWQHRATAQGGQAVGTGQIPKPRGWGRQREASQVGPQKLCSQVPLYRLCGCEEGWW